MERSWNYKTEKISVPTGLYVFLYSDFIIFESSH